MHILEKASNSKLPSKHTFLLLFRWSEVVLRRTRPTLIGNLNSGHIRSALLQLVFDAAISKLLWRLVSRCFYMSMCVFFYDKTEVTRYNVTKSLSTVAKGDREMFESIMLAVCRILDKLHIFSNILCTCSIFIKM